MNEPLTPPSERIKAVSNRAGNQCQDRGGGVAADEKPVLATDSDVAQRYRDDENQQW